MRSRTLWAIVGVALLLSPLTLHADAPSVRAELKPNQAHLGDLLTLDIAVSHAPELIVEPPAFSKTLGTFEVFASTQLPTDRGPAQWTDRFQAQLQNFTTGPQVLSGIDIQYRDPMGKVGHVKTPDVQVRIDEVPAGPNDKGDIRGIKGVIGPVAWSPWWWLLLAAALVAAGAWLWQKRQRVIQGPPPPTPVPPDEAALKKLRELEAAGWLESGKIKEFYSALSDIVRGYIEGAFATPALERTTTELMRALQKRNAFSAQQLQALRDFLEDCDLVKFAKFRPEESEARKQMTVAVRFVEETGPKEASA